MLIAFWKPLGQTYPSLKSKTGYNLICRVDMGVVTPGEAFNLAPHANRVSASLLGEIRVGTEVIHKIHTSSIDSKSLFFVSEN